MRDALNATGRPIFFSLCGWNEWYAPVGQSLGNSWRIGPDDTNWHGVLANIDIMARVQAYAGPGGWNDPCLLLAEDDTGRQRVTEMQTRAQFSMWAVMAAPLLISANVRNMSKMNLATYSNAKVIAVSQDSLAYPGIRMAGDSVSPGGGGGGGSQHATLSTCNAADATQQWGINTPASGYVHNNATNKCLNVDNCGTDVIYYACVMEGCCGSDCNNMRFQVTNDNKLVSPNNPGKCVSSAGGTLNFVDCSAVNGGDDGGGAEAALSDDMYWTYDAKSKLVANGRARTGCISTAQPKLAGTNVWGRKLANADVAVVFLNAGTQEAAVVCDASCWAKIGVPGGATLKMTELYSGEAVTGQSSAGYSVTLPGEGGSAMYRVSYTTTM